MIPIKFISQSMRFAWDNQEKKDRISIAMIINKL